jgi:hypothetical protein
VKTDETTAAFAKALHASGIIGEPCNENMIRDLEQQIDVKLPAAYRAFLLVAGRGFPTWQGSHHTFDDIMGLDDRRPPLQSWGDSLLKRHGSRLPDGAFVFFIHQGAALEFFLLDGGDNPAVFEWVDFQLPQPIKQVAPSFTEHVLTAKLQLEEWLARPPDGA